MDLAQLANLGEFVGGIAVLVTLIYLAMQVRQSNAIELAETHRSFVRDWNQAALQPLREASAANILRRGNRDFEGLNDDEKVQIFGHYGQLLFLSQQLYLLHQDGRAEAALAEQIETVILTILGMPGAAQWFDQAKGAFVPEYVAHLEARRLSRDGPSPLNETYPAFMATEES